MRGLTGKLAIVTGAGSGIGRAIALRLAQEGCVIGVFDINIEGAAATVQQIEESGGRAMAVQCDITSHGATQRALAELEQRVGATDILVNCAGWDKLLRFVDSEPPLWETVIAINLVGQLNMHHAVLPGMAQRKSGRVINIASDAGRVGSSGEAVYSACKGGMIAFSKTIAREMAGKGITVNVVCPGPTDTPLLDSFRDEGEWGEKVYESLKRAIPLRRFGQPEDIAGIVTFLASDEASFITGQVISVSGGLTMHG